MNTETSVVGSVSVGILDENGDSISGFSVEDADPIQGNTVNAVASWEWWCHSITFRSAGQNNTDSWRGEMLVPSWSWHVLVLLHCNNS